MTKQELYKKVLDGREEYYEMLINEKDIDLEVLLMSRGECIAYTRVLSWLEGLE